MKAEAKVAEKSISEIHYNEVPNDFREIDANEFLHLFFLYCFKDAISKQVHGYESGMPLKESHTSIKFWEVEYSGWEGLGVAMAGDYKNGKYSPRYFKFGSEKRWLSNGGKFADQFAGDNS